MYDVQKAIKLREIGIERKKRRLAKSPKHPNADRWRDGIAQLEEAIQNLKKYGHARPYNPAPIGVGISVPKVGGE